MGKKPLGAEVHHNIGEGDEKKNMAWSCMTKGLQYQSVDFSDSKILLKVFERAVFVCLFSFLKFR